MLQYDRYIFRKRKYEGLRRESGDDILLLHEAPKGM